MKTSINPNNDLADTKSVKKERPFLKASGSVLLAIIASSHHWLHTLLLALGLTTLGSSLFSLSPAYRLGFLAVSLLFSVWFIVTAKKKWKKNRPAAWVYLVSSIISLAIVSAAIPQALSEWLQDTNTQVEQNENTGDVPDHLEHHP